MFKIYEIRNKNTHRVEHLNFFRANEQKPDEAFREDPESQRFANRYDLYIYVNHDSYETMDVAVEESIKLMIKYKLIKVEEEEVISNVQSWSFGTDPTDPRNNNIVQEEVKQNIFIEEKPKVKRSKN